MTATVTISSVVVKAAVVVDRSGCGGMGQDGLVAVAGHRRSDVNLTSNTRDAVNIVNVVGEGDSQHFVGLDLGC